MFIQFLLLYHARYEPLCQRLCCRVEVAQHCVASPPTHKADRVCVNARHDEGLGAAGSYKSVLT